MHVPVHTAVPFLALLHGIVIMFLTTVLKHGTEAWYRKLYIPYAVYHAAHAKRTTSGYDRFTFLLWRVPCAASQPV